MTYTQENHTRYMENKNIQDQGTIQQRKEVTTYRQDQPTQQNHMKSYIYPICT